MRILFYDEDRELTTQEVHSVSYCSDLLDAHCIPENSSNFEKPVIEGLWIEPLDSEVYKEMFIRNVSHTKSCEICEQLLEEGFADLRDVGIVEYYNEL